MKTAYYGSRISDSISRTPEGFLICRDVPIARVGVQDYLGREIGQEERPDEIFKVNRPAEEVFSPAAVASFEGKPVTENHPDEDVTSENYGQYTRGVVRDVRKGTGKYEGCLVADLVIHDGALVRRSMSCSPAVSLMLRAYREGRTLSAFNLNSVLPLPTTAP